MEKFGIFELLDALSAIADVPPMGAPSPASGGEKNGETAKGREQTAENRTPDATGKRSPDAAFAPPSYGTDPPSPAASGRTAYEGFLARHASATSKVKK